MSAVLVTGAYCYEGLAILPQQWP